MDARTTSRCWPRQRRSPYEETADDVAKQKRLIEHVRTLYRKDDLTALLPLGTLGVAGPAGRELQARVHARAAGPASLRASRPASRRGPAAESRPAARRQGRGQGGYVARDGNWWIPSGRGLLRSGRGARTRSTAAQELAHARQHFFLPRRYRDPFGHEHGTSDYDDPHDLLVDPRRSDALGNTVGSSVNDYRVLQPRIVTDPNRNRSAVAFDALGMVVATAVMGKPGENRRRPARRTSMPIRRSPICKPSSPIRTAKPPPCWARRRRASSTTSTASARSRPAARSPPRWRAKRTVTIPAARQTKIQVSFSYSDGFGREIQKKIQAEAGRRAAARPDVHLPTATFVRRARSATPGQCRSEAMQPALGRQRLDGLQQQGQAGPAVRAVLQRDASASSSSVMTDTGVSPVLFYDPVERVVATLHPNHTYEKVVFDPWRQDDLRRQRHGAQRPTGDPRTDAGHRGLRRRVLQRRSLPTWQTLARAAHAADAAGRARAATAARQGRGPRGHADRSRTSTRSAAPSSPSRTTSSMQRHGPAVRRGALRHRASSSTSKATSAR